MADLDLDMADTKEEKREVGEKKASYVWRGLRLASKTQLSSFDRVEHGKGLEALQPVAASVEAEAMSGDDDSNNVSKPQDGDRDQGPQDDAQRDEGQRPEGTSQVTADAAETASS